jgi:hypothetical protein
MLKAWRNLGAPIGSPQFTSAAKSRIGCAASSGARERLIMLRKYLEGHIRGMLKTFGIRMIGVGQPLEYSG